MKILEDKTGPENSTVPHSINLVKAAKGIHGERRYLVFAGWWRKWLDYVNFDQDSNHVTRKHENDLPGKKKVVTSGTSPSEAFKVELRQLK